MLMGVRIWILLSTLLVSAGWILSALHQLNRVGYLAAFLLPIIAGFFWQRTHSEPRQPISVRKLKKFRRRFRRPAPRFFLVLALLSFGSAIFLPDLNYDSAAYKLPRVFHWLALQQWHWIHTGDARMNICACGFEWLAAPIILFTHTDRLVFLVNWISFLLLPGLIFSVFTRLQVRPRVAWWWMWFLAAGWCFVLQAGSVDNDSLAAIYILAAVALALRAREKKSAPDLWLSLLAAALATGVKQTNLPLALLWLIAAWPSVRIFWTRPIASAVAIFFALLVSVVPISLLNFQHYRTWLPVDIAGLPSAGNFHLDPFWGILGNAFCIPLQNLMPPLHELLPPFFRYSVSLWNEQMRHFLQTPFGAHFSSFENFGYLSGEYYRGICEGNAGLGLGLCVLIIATWLEMRRQRDVAVHKIIAPDPILFWLRLVPWALLLLFMAKVGTFSIARHLAPYYLLLFPLFLVKPAHARVVRQRRWQRFGMEMMALAVLVLITAGNRPLLPLPSLWQKLHAWFPANEIVADQNARYAESDFQAVRARKIFLNQTLPPTETVVGYYPVICDSDELGLWQPLGRRRVEEVTPEDSPENLRARNIRYVVVHLHLSDGNIAHWLDKYHGTLVAQYAFPIPSAKPAPPLELFLVRLD